MRRRLRSSACLAIVAVLFVLPVVAQDEQDPDEQRGRELLQRSATYLAQLESFRVETEASYDVLQDFGQMLEFGATRTVQVRRPDRVYVSGQNRVGERRDLFFDGRTITFWAVDEEFYAQVPFEGTVDEAIDYMDARLDQPTPLAELIQVGLPEVLEEAVHSVFWVGEATLDGVRCHHLALEGEGLDWQIWVSAEDPPLPRRVVISYHTEGRPGFRADLRNWNVTPKLDDAVFTFEPPPGAARIPVVAERSRQGEGR